MAVGVHAGVPTWRPKVVFGVTGAELVSLSGTGEPNSGASSHPRSSSIRQAFLGGAPVYSMIFMIPSVSSIMQGLLATTSSLRSSGHSIAERKKSSRV